MRVTKYNDLALIKKNNSAAAIVIASSFIAMALLVKNAIYPASAVIQDYWFLADKSPLDLTLLILRVCGYLLLTVILSLISISSALQTFQWLTRDMDEELEIRRNNVAVAILLGGVIVGFPKILTIQKIGNRLHAFTWGSHRHALVLTTRRKTPTFCTT